MARRSPPPAHPSQLSWKEGMDSGGSGLAVCRGACPSLVPRCRGDQDDAVRGWADGARRLRLTLDVGWCVTVVQARHDERTPPPLLADLDCAVRGSNPFLRVCLGSSVMISPPRHRSTRHGPTSLRAGRSARRCGGTPELPRSEMRARPGIPIIPFGSIVMANAMRPHAVVNIGCTPCRKRVCELNQWRYQMAELPPPPAGIVLAHFIVSADVERSRRFYTEVLGGRVVFSGQSRPMSH